MPRILVLVALLLPASALAFDHSAWDKVLKEYVDDRGFVDYQKLADNRSLFDQYIAMIETEGPSSTPDQFSNEDEELAYYINAYNALVFKGVLSRGPETQSVWRGLISGFNFFTLMDIKVDGRETNLKSLENDIIRARYEDPRIHAAINCASISCPRLPREAFTGPQLQAQLDAAIREFVNTPTHVRLEGDTVFLSKIFKWFEEDFVSGVTAETDAQAVIRYINQFRHDELPLDAAVRYLDYDKGINAQN